MTKTNNTFKHSANSIKEHIEKEFISRDLKDQIVANKDAIEDLTLSSNNKIYSDVPQEPTVSNILWSDTNDKLMYKKSTGGNIEITPATKTSLVTDENNASLDSILDDKVDKVPGKSLILDSDIPQITTNKTDIKNNTKDIAKLSSIVNGIQPFTTDWGSYNGAEQTNIIFPSDFPNGIYFCTKTVSAVLCTSDVEIVNGKIIASYYLGDEEGYDFTGKQKTSKREVGGINVSRIETDSIELYNQLISLNFTGELVLSSRSAQTLINVSQTNSASEHLDDYAGVKNQIIIDTTNNTARVMDGTTLGGHALAKQADTYNKTEVDTMIADIPMPDVSSLATKKDVEDVNNKTIENKNDIVDLENRMNSIKPFERDWGIKDINATNSTFSRHVSGRLAYSTTGGPSCHKLSESNFLITGGHYTYNWNTDYSSHVFNTNTESFTEHQVLSNSSLSECASFQDNDRIYTAGKYDSNTDTVSLSIYDLSGNLIKEIPNAIKKRVWYGNCVIAKASDQEVIIFKGRYDSANYGNLISISVVNIDTNEVTHLDSSEHSSLTINVSAAIVNNEAYFFRAGNSYFVKYISSSKALKKITIPSNVGGVHSMCEYNGNILLSTPTGLHLYDLSLETYSSISSNDFAKNLRILLYCNGKIYGTNNEQNSLFNKITIAPIPIEVSQAKSTTESLAEYTGIQGQLMVNTDDNSLYVMDGITKGGHKLAFSNHTHENLNESNGLSEDWGTHSGKEITSIKFPANFEEYIGTDGYFYFMADGDETKEYLGKVLSINGYNIDMQVYMINSNNKDFSAATYPFSMKRTATQISNVETNNLAWFKMVNEGGNTGAIQTVLEKEAKSEVSQLDSNTDALKNYIGVQSQLVINTDDNSLHIMDGVTPNGHKIESNKSFEKEFGTTPFTSNKFDVWNREGGYSESSKKWGNTMWSHNGYVYAWRMNGDIRRFNPVTKEDELYARTSINIPVNNLAVLIKDEIYFLYYGEDRNYAMKKYKFLDRENPSEEMITDNAGPVDSGGTLSCAFSYKDEYYVFIIHNSKTYIKKFDEASKKFIVVHSFDKYNRFISSPVVVKDCVYFCCDRIQGLQKINIKTGILTPTVDMPFYALTLLTDGENEIYACDSSRVPATYLIDEDRYLTDEETGLCAVTSRVNPTHEYINGYIVSYGPYDGTLYNHSVITVHSNRTPIEVSNVTATTATISSYAGVPGQIVYNKDTCTAHIMDGTTKGGHKLATNARVEEVFQSVSNGKELIETAITDKGGTVSKENQVATFGELSNGIHSIQGEDLVGKQLMLDVIIGKLPALDGVLTINSPLSEYANYMFGIGPMNIIAKDTVTTKKYSMSKRQVHYTPTNITEIVTTNLVAPITKPFSEVADMKSSKIKTRKCKVVSLGLSDDAIIEFIEEKKWRVDYDERKSNHRNI